MKLKEVFNSQTHVYMAMEAVDGRELFEEMAEKGKMDETRARGLFVQVNYYRRISRQMEWKQPTRGEGGAYSLLPAVVV